MERRETDSGYTLKKRYFLLSETLLGFQNGSETRKRFPNHSENLKEFPTVTKYLFSKSVERERKDKINYVCVTLDHSTKQ